MTINLERAAMRGKLAELEDNEARLKMKIEGNATAIRTGLNTVLTPVDEMQVPMLAGQMDELVLAWAELQKVQSDIARVKRELR